MLEIHMSGSGDKKVEEKLRTYLASLPVKERAKTMASFITIRKTTALIDAEEMAPLLEKLGYRRQVTVSRAFMTELMREYSELVNSPIGDHNIYYGFAI